MKTIINYDQLYEHPELPFKIKFVRTIEESLQTPEVKSLCFPSTLTELYPCFASATEETPLLHEWLQRNGYDSPEVVKLCDLMWKSTFFPDISDPGRRVIAIVFNAVGIRFDDIFESLTRSKSSERFALNVLEETVRVFSTLEFEPVTSEEIDEKLVSEMNLHIRLFHQIALDTVNCFSCEGHKMFMDACVATFQMYLDTEIPIQARATKEKRYVTLKEWVEVRRLTFAMNTLIPFMYDEKQVFNFDLKRYNQYNTVVAHFCQYCALFNDIISLPTELKKFEPVNMVKKFMCNKNLNEAVDHVIALLDKLTNALEFLYDLTPADQKDISLVYWRIVASGMSAMLVIPRYGWNIVNKESLRS